jgi:hypothetical protein
LRRLICTSQESTLKTLNALRAARESPQRNLSPEEGGGEAIAVYFDPKEYETANASPLRATIKNFKSVTRKDAPPGHLYKIASSKQLSQ